MKIDIKMDVRELNRDLDVLHSGLRDKATVMALNKTVPKARTEMVRAVTSEFNIKAREVRQNLRIMKANKFTLTAILDPFAKGRKYSMNLIRFLESKVTIAELRRRKKSGTRKDLRFKIKKKGVAKTILGAFVGNQGRTIFRRKDQADNQSPIEAVSTVGVPQMFNMKSVYNRVEKRVQKEFPIEFTRSSAQVLRKFNR